MYKVAIPSYKRSETLKKKTLDTLINGGVSSNKIYIFVANKEEQSIYEKAIPRETYNKIVIGEKGIANQRKFIKNYFKEKEEIVSLDDDIEELSHFSNNKLTKLTNVHAFFIDAFKRLKKEHLFIWGIYPVRNAFFMKGKKPVTTILNFLIGGLYGFIVRHDKDLEPSSNSEGKEDYEQSILYYIKDGGVLRFNDIAVKTKFLAKGGLGQQKERFEINRKAAEYLHAKYPGYVTRYYRKNGMAEIKIKDNTHKTKHLQNYTLPSTPSTPKKSKKIIKVKIKKNKTSKVKSKTPSPPPSSSPRPPPPPPPSSSPRPPPPPPPPSSSPFLSNLKNYKAKSICKNKKTKNPNECLTYKECIIAKGPKREFCRSKKNKNR